MSLWNRLEDFIFWALTSAVAALAAGGWWLIRLVFTNQEQIKLLRLEIKHRDQLRAEDREDIAEIKGSVQLIQQHLIGDNDAER